MQLPEGNSDAPSENIQIHLCKLKHIYRKFRRHTNSPKWSNWQRLKLEEYLASVFFLISSPLGAGIWWTHVVEFCSSFDHHASSRNKTENKAASNNIWPQTPPDMFLLPQTPNWIHEYLKYLCFWWGHMVHCMTSHRVKYTTETWRVYRTTHVWYRDD